MEKNLREECLLCFNNREPIIYHLNSNTFSEEFDIDICEQSKNHAFVRFNIKEIIKYEDLYMKSWLKIHKAHCFSNNRPLMFTFFEIINEKRFKNEDGPLLKAWKEAWLDAGWEPVILTEDDAKLHPEYDEFISKLLVDVSGS